MKKTKHPLFLKYLLSYTIMFMVPVLAFTAFINDTLLNELQKQYTRNSTQSLNQLMYITERSMQQLDTIGKHLLLTKNITATYGLDDVEQSRAVIEEIKKYVTSNAFLLDAALFFEGNNYLYTSSSTYLVDHFFEDIYIFENKESINQLNECSEKRQKLVLPYQNVRVHGVPRKLMPVMIPLTFRGHDASILFFVDNMFSNKGNYELAQRYIIFDRDGQTIWEDNIPIKLDSDSYGEINNAILAGKPISMFAEQSKERFLAYGIVSPDTQWRYAYVTEEGAIYGDYRATQRKFVWALALILAVCIIVTSISMSLSYSKLNNLRKISDGLFHDENKSGHDELQDIENNLIGLATENKVLKNNAVSNACPILLQSLLKGRVTSLQEFNDKIKMYGLEKLCRDNFFVLMICLRGIAEQPDCKAIESILGSVFDGYCKEHVESGMYVFVGGTKEADESALRHRLLDAYDLLKTKLNCDVALACGAVLEGYQNIPVSYIEASLAIDYRFIKGSNCVIDYSELALNDSIGVAYPSRLFDKLNYQLKQGNADKIEQALTDIVEYIKASNLPLYYAKGLCYQLINNISMVISDLNSVMNIQQSSLSYATILADFDTADDLVNAIKNICYNICAYIRSETRDKNDTLLESMKDYLNKNCLDGNFSVQNMANEFNMSQPAISALFKTLNGTTIINCVTEIKMKRAKSLMLTTNKPICDIVTEIGYVNTSSFIRRFKELYGITPGQFAELTRKEECAMEKS